MGIIDRFGLTEYWKTNLTDKSTPRHRFANILVIGIMAFFLGYFLVIALSIMAIIWILFDFLDVIIVSDIDI